MMLVTYTRYDVEEEAAMLVPQLLEEFRMADYSVLTGLWESFKDKLTSDQERLNKRQVITITIVNTTCQAKHINLFVI